MGKRRMIDMDGLCFDAEITELGLDACFLYARLWSIAEDWGGFTLNSKDIRLQMGGLSNSYTPERIIEIIQSLIKLNKIIVYEYNEKKYGWIKNFLKHQKLLAPYAPVLPLPQWITWHPKTDPKDPVQHYKIVSMDISMEYSVEQSIEQSVDKTQKQSMDISTEYRREVEVKRKEKNKNSFSVTSLPSTNTSDPKQMNGNEKKLTAQLGVSGLSKPMSKDKIPSEISSTQEKKAISDLEAIRAKNKLLHPELYEDEH